MAANPELGWASYSDEDGTFTGAYRTTAGTLRVNQSRILKGKTHLREFDVGSDGTWALHREDADSGYDPRTRPFYDTARQARHVVWLPPYVFYDQGVPGVTCAHPVFDAAGPLRGVITVDFDLQTLSALVAGLKFSPNARVMITTSDGTVLAHPTARLASPAERGEAGQLFGIAEIDDPQAATAFSQLRPHDFDAASRDRLREFSFDYGGEPHYATVTSFELQPGLTWAVTAFAPQSDFLGGVRRSQYASLAISALCVLVAVALAAALARRVSSPIVSLVAFMGRVGAGHLDDEHRDFGHTREFRRLSAALNRMIVDLRDGIRMRTSLAVANDVQQRLLPHAPPRVPGLDIAGHSTYCDETGGDYFDYLVPDGEPHRLLVVIGDVMGHGVGSALLMAGARGVLRSRARGSDGIAPLVSHLNDHLAADTGGQRFMTMYVVAIDTRAAAIRWCSAGHDPAIVSPPRTASPSSRAATCRWA